MYTHSPHPEWDSCFLIGFSSSFLLPPPASSLPPVASSSPSTHNTTQQHSTAQHNTTQHSTAAHSTAQLSTTLTPQIHAHARTLLPLTHVGPPRRPCRTAGLSQSLHLCSKITPRLDFATPPTHLAFRDAVQGCRGYRDTCHLQCFWAPGPQSAVLSTRYRKK